MSFILAKKLKMTQIWQGGKIVPVTILKAEPNKVSGVRTHEKDGYEAVQVALGKAKKEFRGKPAEGIAVGAEVGVAGFKEGDTVRVSGFSKGKGFQGVVKRHGFGGGPKTHGQKNRFRAGGSIGSTAPQRVTPGRRMPGHMGDERITVKNLKVAAVDADKNILMLKGAVPGGRGALIEVQTAK